jgi:hypothetical protein
MTDLEPRSDLSYYRSAGPMTAIDEDRFGRVLQGLGTEPAALAKAVRGVLVHRDWAPLLGLDFGPERLADQHLRSVADVIARILELRADDLATPRAAGDRMVGVCRHFAVLYAAFLRRQGIPARARAGFARYFRDEWVDHWVTERWERRWIRDDAQIGSVARARLGLEFDPADQPPGEFLTGAEAWLRCRAGDVDPEKFGIFDLRGLWFVLGDLLLDFAALNQVELLPWDVWDTWESAGIGGGPEWKPAPEELACVDDLAALSVADDVDAIRHRYRSMPVPRRIVSLVDRTPTPVDLGPLVDLG